MGHGLAGRYGQDISCAAATSLLRTCARLLAAQPELEVEAEAPHPGEMYLLLRKPPKAFVDWIRGTTDYMLCGLKDLKTEYPDNLKLEINDKPIGA